MAAVVLVAAAALPFVKSTMDSKPPGATRSTVDGIGPTFSPPPGPKPPYDRRPGRTPIPAPAQTGDGLSGLLPMMTGPDRRAAGTAVDLVLGRYCLEPMRYVFTLEPDHNGTQADWHHVRVLVFDVERSYAGAAMRLFLDWAGPSYRWLGFLNLLDGC